MIYLLIKINGDIEDKDKIVDLLVEGDENGTTPDDYGSQYFDTKESLVRELTTPRHNPLAPCVLCGNSLMDEAYDAAPLAVGNCCANCNIILLERRLKTEKYKREMSK